MRNKDDLKVDGLAWQNNFWKEWFILAVLACNLLWCQGHETAGHITNTMEAGRDEYCCSTCFLLLI